jgi:hypothetical protein
MPDEPRPSLSSLSTPELRARAAEYAERAANAQLRGAADALRELAAQLERIAAEREVAAADTAGWLLTPIQQTKARHAAAERLT